jgi:hypothetical protein
MTYKPVNKLKVTIITAVAALIGTGGFMAYNEYNKTPEEKAAAQAMSVTKEQLNHERDQVGEAAAAYMSATLIDAANQGKFDEDVTPALVVEDLKEKFNTANVSIKAGEADGCICGSVSGATVTVVDRLGKTESYSR